MASFDPYHIWLGIPPEDQPPSHYRLLGIPELESNPDVIDTAAEMRTLLLRTFQTSDQSQLAEQLLNEVSATRICLLNAEQKAEYDRQLQVEMKPAPVPPPPVTDSPAVVVKADPPAISVEQPVPSGRQPRRRKQKISPFWQKPRMLAAAGGLVAMILLVVLLNSGKDKSLPASLNQGLVAYYPFNGNAKDESGNGHDGSFINGSSFTEDRNLNKFAAFSLESNKQSIQFDGLGPYAPTTTQGMSISFWATRNVMANVMGQNTVFAIQLETEDDNGYDWNIFGNGHGTFRGAPKHYSNDLWQHWFVQIFPGDKGVKVFVNGKLEVGGYSLLRGKKDYVGDKPGHFALNSDTQSTPVSLVHTYGNPTNDNRGSLDDIRIYNRAFSDAEVKALYEYEKP